MFTYLKNRTIDLATTVGTTVGDVVDGGQAAV